MHDHRISQDDDTPDGVVQWVALVAVGIMLAGMIVFPMAGARGMKSAAGSASVATHGVDAVAIKRTDSL